jgi:hypothetical protein
MNRWLTLPVAMLSIAAAASACSTRENNAVLVPAPPAEVQTQLPTAPRQPETVVGGTRGSIPVGQEMDVRMSRSLSSETATVEQRFEATTVVDLLQDGGVLIPAGSVVEGVVSGVEKAGRLLDRQGSLTLAFDRIRVRGRDVPIRATATQVFESGGIREEAGTAGVGAGVGGVIGGLLGGVKGAIIGAVVGAGGAIAATDGKDVTIPAGAIVRLRIDSAVRVAG